MGMARNQILLVDDDPKLLRVLTLRLEAEGYGVIATSSGEEALQRLDDVRPRMVLADLRMPDLDGIQLLVKIQGRHPSLPVAILSAHGDIPDAVRATHAGAVDFLTKPVDRERLISCIERHVAGDATPNGAHGVVTRSPLMRAVLEDAQRIARTESAVLITGASGTGKEVLAQALHACSSRRQSPFVAINCTAVPAELLESELFGHRKGSFTGAHEDKPGLFQAANGGTLFLDEVADLPLAMQVKLLRAIQEKSVRAVGGQQEQIMDVRVLCATHKDLSVEVASGRFRQDLYYRLNVIELRVPPLRERREDIEEIASSVLRRLAANADQPPARLAAQAMTALKAYRFPGNVRELENMLERAYTLCENEQINADDLRLAEPTSPSEQDGPNLADIDNLEDYLESIERKLILQALEETRWNRTAAAQRLNLTFRSMRYRLKKLGLE